MTNRLEKEVTLTLGQLLAICSTLLIPGLVGVSLMIQRLTVLETWKTEHVVAGDKTLAELKSADAALGKSNDEFRATLGVINENVTQTRISVARLLPAGERYVVPQ